MSKPIKLSAQACVLIALAFTLAASANVVANDKKFAVSLTTDTPKQGQTVEITVASPKEDGGTGNSATYVLPQIEFNHHIYKCFPENANTFKSLIAIPVDLAPSTYALKVSAADGGNNNSQVSEDIQVKIGKFVVQKLSLPKQAAALTPATGEEEAVDKAKATLSSERLWQGTFSLPVKARVSTTFGAQRIVNGKKLTDYYHSGIDYAAGMGQAVAACAAGKVILVGTNFALHGNTVAIDHGQGVISFYLHLQKILVKTGQVVKAGDIIGKVGETGRANGPHLHFSLYVNQVSANPNDWYKQLF